MRLTLLVAVLALFLGAAIDSCVPLRVQAWTPLRVITVGSACLYVTDTGGIWGASKSALITRLPYGPEPPCPMP